MGLAKSRGAIYLLYYEHLHTLTRWDDMRFCNFFICFIGITQFFVSIPEAAPDSNFHCYLLFGQSNMAGGGNTTGIIDEDCDTTPRVKVLAFCDCAEGAGQNCREYSSKREHDKWYTAFPPLHICSEGISPGDWFAKTMLDSIHEDITIGLIPCALSGQSIKVFVKGGKNFIIPAIKIGAHHAAYLTSLC